MTISCQLNRPNACSTIRHHHSAAREFAFRVAADFVQQGHELTQIGEHGKRLNAEIAIWIIPVQCYQQAVKVKPNDSDLWYCFCSEIYWNRLERPEFNGALLFAFRHLLALHSEAAREFSTVPDLPQILWNDLDNVFPLL